MTPIFALVLQPNVIEARIVFGTFVACRIMHTVRKFASIIINIVSGLCGIISYLVCIEEMEILIEHTMKLHQSSSLY